MADKVNNFDDALRVIAKGAGIAFFGLTLNRFLAFLSRVIVARFLTPNDYGILNLVLAIFSVFVVISLIGIPDGIIRYISYYAARKEYDKVKGVIYSSIRIVIPISIILSILVFYFSRDISRIFHDEMLEYPLKIISFAIPFWVLARVFKAASVGFKKIDYSILIDLLHQIIRFTIVVVVLLLGYRLIGVIFGYFLAFVFSPIIGYYFLQRIDYLDSCGIEFVDMELISYSWPLLLASFSSLILAWTDTLMIGYFRGDYYVGIYNAAYPIAQLLTIFGVSFSNIFMPVITEFYSADSLNNLKRTYVAVTKWIFGLTFPSFLFLVSFGDWIIEILFGDKYISGYYALSILAIGFFTNSVLILNSGVIKSVEKTKFIMVNSYIIAVLNIILNASLIPVYGVAGAAIATTVSMITSALISLMYLYKLIKIVPISRKCLYSVPAAVISIIIIYLPAKIALQYGIFTLIPNLMLYFVIYFFLLLIFKYFDSEDVIIMKAIESKIGIDLEPLRKIIIKFL